ncbi:MAG: hypothetical protein ACJAU1_001910, partial [Psychromonas sp.]
MMMKLPFSYMTDYIPNINTVNIKSIANINNDDETAIFLYEG